MNDIYSTILSNLAIVIIIAIVAAMLILIFDKSKTYWD